MSYLVTRRYGLTHVEPSERERASGWRQVWEHPSGMRAMRHPATGYWVVSEFSYETGWILYPGFSSSLRAVARSIERKLAERAPSEIV